MQNPYPQTQNTRPPPPQYQPILQSPPTPPPVSYQPTLQDKVTGKRFSRAVILTILFLVLSNSYKVLENAYALFTSRTGEILSVETFQPTLKGYAIMAALFFVSVLFTSWW